MYWDLTCSGASLSLDKKTILNTSKYGGARSKTSYTTGKRYWEVTFGSGAIMYGMFGFNQGSEWLQNQYVWGQPGMELVYGNSGYSLYYAKTLKFYSGSYGSYTSGTYGFAIDIPGQYFYMYFPDGSVTTFTFTFKNEPIYIMDGAGDGEIRNIVLNTTEPFQKTIPDGFKSWDPLPHKHLYYFNNKTYKVDNNILVEVSNTIPTENDFKDNGMNTINSSDVSLINGPYTLYTYDYNNEASNTMINTTVNQKEKIIKSKLISLADVEHIDNLILTGTNIKLFISNDNITWHTYKNSSWNPYTLNSDNLNLNGMTISEFNNIPNSDLNTFLNTGKMYFACILDSTSSKLDNIELQADLSGTWEILDQFTNSTQNYYFKFNAGDKLTSNLYLPGTYKINF